MRRQEERDAARRGDETVKSRSWREELRRRVAQWTYGYEYEQLGEFLQDPGRAPKLLADYQRAEVGLLGGCASTRVIRRGWRSGSGARDPKVPPGWTSSDTTVDCTGSAER